MGLLCSEKTQLCSSIPCLYDFRFVLHQVAPVVSANIKPLETQRVNVNPLLPDLATLAVFFSPRTAGWSITHQFSIQNHRISVQVITLCYEKQSQTSTQTVSCILAFLQAASKPSASITDDGLHYRSLLSPNHLPLAFKPLSASFF